jgi:ribose 5-phosphate isomerase B
MISIGSDHAGYELKEKVKSHIKQAFPAEPVQDEGTFSPESSDYPDYAHKVAEKVAAGSARLGILICGSGNGVCMTANRHRNVRAALCWTKEIAILARQHNNANIICIPARFVSVEAANEMVEAFFKTDFEGGRHQRRVEKMETGKEQ